MNGSNEVISLSAVEMLRSFGNGNLSPVDVMSAHLQQCERQNSRINAVFGVRADYAMKNARRSEARWQKGEPAGPLDGLPILLKDSIKCEGFDYFHGSASYDGSPADHDAPLAARIKEDGGLVYGKTTMPDYGMLAAGVSSVFGIVRNPWNTAVNTGGSSAGSGASVAAGLAPLAVGTDIAGSVRLPCAHNGLVGLKPSRGRIPHLAPSPIRAAGPMARTVEDAGLLMGTLVRPDSRDYESMVPCDESAYRKLGHTPDGFLLGKRIGLMLDMGFGQTPEQRVIDLIKKQAKVFEDLGASVDLVPTVAHADPMDALYSLFQSRAYYELVGRPSESQHNLLPHIDAWCRKTEKRSAHQLSIALFELEDFKARVVSVLEPFDYVISPSLTIVSFPADHVGAVSESHFAHCSYQIPFNQIGTPALSINAGFIEELPVGMQIAGKRYDDLGVLMAAMLYEQNRGFEIDWPM
ncbi:MAG: amidase [Aestuariivita sp.]|nr:amidase [Aestuariivita sp.]